MGPEIVQNKSTNQGLEPRMKGSRLIGRYLPVMTGVCHLIGPYSMSRMNAHSVTDLYVMPRMKGSRLTGCCVF